LAAATLAAATLAAALATATSSAARIVLPRGKCQYVIHAGRFPVPFLCHDPTPLTGELMILSTDAAACRTPTNQQPPRGAARKNN
jgi:hypothetical protein